MDNSGAQEFGEGFSNLYEPSLKLLRSQISELTAKQTAVLADLEKENRKFSAINTNELSSMFMMIRDYHVRVHYIKKEMLDLAERSSKLKKRALRLQHYKQKEALEMAHYREAQMKREQDLIAKPDPNFQLP